MNTMRYTLAVAIAALALGLNLPSVSAQNPLDKKWNHGSDPCTDNTDPQFQILRYDANTYILRENKCTSRHAPFSYLFFGEDKAILFGTGANPDNKEDELQIRKFVDQAIDHFERAVELVLAAGHRRIGVLGLSFKAGTDDLRESPMVKLVESLIGKGLELAIFDRDVSEAQVLGANREYIEREIPHIWSLMRSTVADVLARADTVIIGKDFRDPVQIAACLTDRHTIVDLVRVFENSSSGGHHYHGDLLVTG